jgi:carboxylesterase type B
MHFVTQSNKVNFFPKLSDHTLALPFGPVTEKPSSGAFITEEPLQIIKSGAYNKVPTVFGYTTREGMLFEIAMKPRKPEVPKNFERFIPFMLQVEPGSDSSKNIANKIKQFYYGAPGAEDKIDNFYLVNKFSSIEVRCDQE